MPIRVKCEKCKKTLSVKDHLAGKKIKCPVCQGIVAVPLAAPTKEAPAAGKTGAPTPKAASSAAKKPVAAKTKPKPDANGAAPPSSNGEHTNGKAADPPTELPPENVEEAALSALADEPPPPEETQEPQFVQFKCQWCDEEVKLPLELAGKQAQCPNAECKRIVKVPLPKAPEKKDWRKMQRQGPAAAKINLPEALDNAWGTEEATRARQDSLAQAGAIADTRPPVGVFGWMRRGSYGIAALAVLAVVAALGARLFQSHEQHNVLKDIDALVKGDDAKITEPVLKAEAERTRGLHQLYSNPQVGFAKKAFLAAKSPINIGDESPSLDKPFLHEQFFLIDLALSQIETGGSGDDVRGPKGRTKRQEWGETQEDLAGTLRNIKSPEVQVIALREVTARLAQQPDLKEKDKFKALAIGLAGGLSAGGGKQRPLAFRQQIALIYWSDAKKLEGIADEKELETVELDNADLRVGFAEGYARAGKLEDAFKLASQKGPEEHKLDAFLGIAAVTLDANKDQSTRALKQALDIAKDDKTVTTPWQWLEIARLGARLGEKDSVKQAFERLSGPFKLRAELEVFLALCDQSATPVSTDALNDLAADDKEGVTLALAWMALARQHARTAGAGRAANLKTFNSYAQLSSFSPNIIDMISPMVIIGTYQWVK